MLILTNVIAFFKLDSRSDLQGYSCTLLTNQIMPFAFDFKNMANGFYLSGLLVAQLAHLPRSVTSLGHQVGRSVF